MVFQLARKISDCFGVPVAAGGDTNTEEHEDVNAALSDAGWKRVDYEVTERRYGKHKIYWLYVFNPEDPLDSTTFLAVVGQCVAIDPAGPYRTRQPGVKVHLEYFDHDALLVTLRLLEPAISIYRVFTPRP
jgi:hypothetical protein